MTSLFAYKIQAALDYRQSLGKSIQHQGLYLSKFDGFCFEKYPTEGILTKEIAWDWVFNPLHKSASAARQRIKALNFFSRYLVATGEDAYVFPDAMTSTTFKPSPYVFTIAPLFLRR